MRLCLLPLLLLLTACPGPVAQLERLQADEQGGRFAAIEAATVDSDCTSADASEACPRIAAIRGRACLQLARDATAPGAACPGTAQRSRMDCAAASYAGALRSTAFPEVQRQEFLESRARALYCGATYRGAAEGVPLARAAIEALSLLPPEPRRDQLAAAASLNIAGRETLFDAERCERAKDARRLARRGLAATPGADLAGALRAAIRNADDETRRITGCTPG